MNSSCPGTVIIEGGQVDTPIPVKVPRSCSSGSGKSVPSVNSPPALRTLISKRRPIGKPDVDSRFTAAVVVESSKITFSVFVEVPSEGILYFGGHVIGIGPPSCQIRFFETGSVSFKYVNASFIAAVFVESGDIRNSVPVKIS